MAQALMMPGARASVRTGVVQPLIVTIGAYPLKTSGSRARGQQDILINAIPVMKEKYGDQADIHLEQGANSIGDNKGRFEDLIINSHGSLYTINGMNATTLAAGLVAKGYKGGGKIILSACNSAQYASDLAKALRENHGIEVEVIGALASVLSRSETVKGFDEKGWQSSKVHGTENAPLLGTSRPTSSRCFLTSACVHAQGLGDHCTELDTLRRFRDEELLRWPGGTEAVELYYVIAPQILTVLDEDPGRDLIYQALYRDLIVPCVVDIAAGRYAAAYLRYEETVRQLFMELVVPRAHGQAGRIALTSA